MIRLCLTTLEHDHAWWTLDQVRETPGVELVGVADDDPARCARAGAVPLYRDVEEMLAACVPDGLIVTAANRDHRRLAGAAAARGVACLVQKPMATTYADAVAMRDEAERAGTLLMVNYFPLWQPLKSELFARLGRGDLGPLRQVMIQNGHQGPRGIGVLTEDYQRWLYDPVRHGGGALVDQATYGIAYVTWLLGRPTTVLATETPVRRHPAGLDDLATVVLTYPGAQAQIVGAWAWPHRSEALRWYGDAGSLELTGDRLVYRRATDRIDQTPAEELIASPSTVDDSTVDDPTVDDPARRHGVAHFAHAIRHGTAVDGPHSAAHGVLVTEVTEAAQRSARDGTAVLLSPR